MDKIKTVELSSDEMKIIHQALREVQQDLIDEPNMNNDYMISVISGIKGKLRRCMNGD